MKRTLQILALIALTVLPWLLVSCQSPKVRTTTTRMGITGAQETSVTEVPWESAWDQAFASALRGAME